MAFNWLEFFSPHIQGLKAGSNEWAKGKCPWHDDRRASLGLHLQNGSWVCHAGCGKGNARALCEKLGIHYPFSRRSNSKRPSKSPQAKARVYRPPQSQANVIATYIYTDENGQPLFRKHRTADKNFWFERSDGKGGWLSGLKGARIVPYRLHEIVKAERVCITEGCQDADTLHAMEFVATTAPFGAERWPEEFSPFFKGKEVWAFRDNDKPGRRYQLEAALNCFPTAKSVKLIHLPGLGEKEDVTDWCNKRHTKEQLLKIIHNAPVLTKDDLPHLERELQGLQQKTRPPSKKIKTGEQILSEDHPQPRLHPAMDWRGGVLILGFRYGENSLWITSNREILSQDQLKDTYGETRTSPLGGGPSKQACQRWISGQNVDGPALFLRIRDFLLRYVLFQYHWQADLAALWALNTYLHRIHPICPGLHATAPEKASGKTRLLDVMAAICFGNPQLQVDPSEAVLFREPELTALPLFWDEAETLYRVAKNERDERLSVLNAGYRNGAVVKRFDKNTATIISYPVYRPLVLSGISRLPDTIASRCLTLELQRKKASEKIEDFNPSRAQQETARLRDDCYLWALGNVQDVADAYRVASALPIPEGVHGRLREILEPLFAIAIALDQANSTGPTIAALQEAAKNQAGIVAERETEESARIEALQVLYQNFPDGQDRWALKTETWMKLCQENGMDWIEKPNQAQRLLRGWGWKSEGGHIEGARVRAYYIHRRSLADKVERYAPHLLTPPTPAPTGNPQPDN